MTSSFQADVGLRSDICIFKMEPCSLTVFLLAYGIYFLIIIFTWGNLRNKSFQNYFLGSLGDFALMFLSRGAFHQSGLKYAVVI